MTPTSPVLDRPALPNKFTVNAALEELLWIDTQLKYFAPESLERRQLMHYRNWVESHTDISA